MAAATYELYPENAVLLTREQARALTDDVKADAQALWLKLVDLYNGQAHVALGFKSWRAYCAAEFGLDRNAAHRLLMAGQVMEQLHPGARRDGASPLGDTSRAIARHSQEPSLPRSERVARELGQLKDEPEKLRKAWDETVEKHGPQPTGEQVRNVVQRIKGVARTPSEPLPEWVGRARRAADELLVLAAPLPSSPDRADHIDRWLELMEQVMRDVMALREEDEAAEAVAGR